MRAVGYFTPQDIATPGALLDLEVAEPVPGPRDLLVRVRGVGVNPVDTKIRRRRVGAAGVPVVLGWDAAGEVLETGAECRLFRPGDRVWYAGERDRAGCNAEHQVVDERLVGRMPAGVSWEYAAGLPLTALTAFESLFERLGVPEGGAYGQRLLVVGGAGGVGSIAIQLAQALTELVVIATASRPESAAWCRRMGADDVVDHRGDLVGALRDRGHGEVDYVLLCADTDPYLPLLPALLAPQGAACAMVDTARPVDLRPLKEKSLRIAWEFMFTRPLFRTPDMIRHHEYLCRLAELVEAGRVRSTVTGRFGVLNADNLARAHAQVESGTTIGKIALSGY
ncbi:MAG: zinc-binding alcohol dehydrogenase family protein [Gemmatimonadales bacterium]|jgi:zinc-binding alcohol dehydrogenase family protein|nr:zinc-binding alcohol dehydrogenase family protein [Gemmatimonadales bacterium]